MTARGRVWRECPHPSTRDVMPWTWQCHAEWNTCPHGSGITARSGIATRQEHALDAMNEHLEAHRVR